MKIRIDTDSTINEGAQEAEIKENAMNEQIEQELEKELELFLLQLSPSFPKPVETFYRCAALSARREVEELKLENKILSGNRQADAADIERLERENAELTSDKSLLETELTRQIDGYRAEVADRENELMKAGTAYDNAQATINGLKARVALLEKAVRENWAKNGRCVFCGAFVSTDNLGTHFADHKSICIVLTCKEDKV